MGSERGNPSDFASNFPQASQRIENAVLVLLSGGWEECDRLYAQEMAVALTQAARAAGCWGPESVLRALTSILSLSILEIYPIRQAVREKLLELLGLLKKYRASRSA